MKLVENTSLLQTEDNILQDDSAYAATALEAANASAAAAKLRKDKGKETALKNHNALMNK